MPNTIHTRQLAHVPTTDKYLVKPLSEIMQRRDERKKQYEKSWRGRNTGESIDSTFSSITFDETEEIEYDSDFTQDI